MRAVVDTNVFLSALLTPTRFETPPVQIVHSIAQGRFRPVLSLPIFEEYVQVANRPQFTIAPDAVNELLDLLGRAGEWIEPAAVGVLARDPDDQKFLDAGATADYLVTGNRRHYPDLEWIVTPRQFVDRLRSGS